MQCFYPDKGVLKSFALILLMTMDAKTLTYYQIKYSSVFKMHLNLGVIPRIQEHSEKYLLSLFNTWKK